MSYRLVFSLLMSFVLCFLMTVWITFINLGAVEGFFMSWARAFLFAWPVAWLISFSFGPKIAAIAQKLCKQTT
ncbi:DUF2798 domain-containing protein [Pseudocolwellia agarivorans]|uniref:DUF2798 domain-containing protein n=1 Tax=Pseudocolwellia agarivorans TaxID=1911682 RepID=UPI003F881F97